MKKIIAIVFSVAILLVASLGLVACADDDLTTVRLNEVTHSVFYAPLYIAINNGYFEDAGIKIELTDGGGADKTMAALVSGSADIGLMGPESNIYCNVQGMQNAPMVFGQLTKRDGSFLVSKKNEKDTFKWSDLEGKRVLVGRQGGVPAMTIQYVANKFGIVDGVNGTNLDTSIAFNMQASVFDADKTVDYTTLFEPTATEFEKAGKGYIVASVGSESGEVPFTTFSAMSSYLKNHRDTAKAFLAAVYRGYEFMQENDSATVATALSKSFTGLSVESLTYVVESYIAIDAWNNTPVMTAASLDRLQDIMINAGELTNKVNFADIVDNSIAREVIGVN